MPGLSYIQTILGLATDKVKKFDWSTLVPKAKVDRYQYAAPGIELTWRVGPGIGLGLGVIDVWVGWPRPEQNLHFAGCLHDKSAKEDVVVVAES